MRLWETSNKAKWDRYYTQRIKNKKRDSRVEASYVAKKG